MSAWLVWLGCAVMTTGIQVYIWFSRTTRFAWLALMWSLIGAMWVLVFLGLGVIR